MKSGRISNTIYDRSVYKLLKNHTDSIIEKPQPGTGAAHLPDKALIKTATGRWGVLKIANYIGAAGGILEGVTVSIVMDENSREIRLKEIMNDLEEQCALAGADIADITVTVNDRVNKPIVVVTGVGTCLSVAEVAGAGTHTSATEVTGTFNCTSAGGCIRAKARPGEDIILTKCIGMGGINRIIDAKKEDILKKYTEDVILKAKGSIDELLVTREARAFLEEQCKGSMSVVDEGGIFAALWNMAEYSGTGLMIDFRSIPVRQEIIEICEMYDINPYNLDSTGCLLMTSENGCDIVKMLDERGIRATVIGKVTEGNDRIVHNLEEDRFLGLPEQDEIYRLSL